MGIIYDSDGIPDWQNVRLTKKELKKLCDAADKGDQDTANAIVEAAYERLYAEREVTN